MMVVMVVAGNQESEHRTQCLVDPSWPPRLPPPVDVVTNNVTLHQSLLQNDKSHTGNCYGCWRAFSLEPKHMFLDIC